MFAKLHCKRSSPPLTVRKDTSVSGIMHGEILEFVRNSSESKMEERFAHVTIGFLTNLISVLSDTSINRMHPSFYYEKAYVNVNVLPLPARERCVAFWVAMADTTTCMCLHA